MPADYECPCETSLGKTTPQIHEPWCCECELCGERYCIGLRHFARCGLPCSGSALNIEDDVVHDLECVRCSAWRWAG